MRYLKLFLLFFLQFPLFLHKNREKTLFRKGLSPIQAVLLLQIKIILDDIYHKEKFENSAYGIKQGEYVHYTFS